MPNLIAPPQILAVAGSGGSSVGLLPPSASSTPVQPIVRRRTPRKCSTCQRTGHNKNNCPGLDQPDVVPAVVVPAVVVTTGDFEQDEELEANQEEECAVNGEDVSGEDDDVLVGDGFPPQLVCVDEDGWTNAPCVQEEKVEHEGQPPEYPHVNDMKGAFNDRRCGATFF